MALSRRFFLTASRKDLNNPHSLVHLARLDLLEGNTEHAARRLRHAIERNPGDPHAWNHLSHLIKQDRKGDVKVLRDCFQELNALHPTAEAHVLRKIRDNVTLEDLEKFVHVGYQFHRFGTKYDFLDFVFKALGEIKTDRKNVFLNLDWFSYEPRLSIMAEIPDLQLNIFCPGFRRISSMAEKNIVLIGQVEHLEFLHDCKIYVSSPNLVTLHQVNHSPLYLRNGVKTYDALSGSSLKIGGDFNCANLSAVEGNSFWIFGHALELGVQGSNDVYVHRKNLQPGEDPWWWSKAA